MIDQKVSKDFETYLRNVSLEIIEELNDSGFDISKLSGKTKISLAIKESISLYGFMNFLIADINVENEELEKTLRLILENKEEFREYLKNAFILA